MAAHAGCALKLPAVNDRASFEIAHVTSAQVALKTDELYGSGSLLPVGPNRLSDPLSPRERSLTSRPECYKPNGTTK